MNNRWQLLFRMAERRKQPLDAIQHEIDALRMKRKQAVKDGVATCDNGHGTAAPAITGACRGDADCRIKRRTRRDRVARKSWRWTTMSTIPCSSKYSARWNQIGRA